MTDQTALITMTQLKERGWTAALVKKFLDPPDETRPNPHYKSAAPMRLYTAPRVEAAESCEDWKTAVARARARSEVSKAVAARKAAKLIKEAEQLLTTYDEHLEEAAGRIGMHEASAAIRRRVNAAIEATFPASAAGIPRQMQFREAGGIRCNSSSSMSSNGATRATGALTRPPLPRRTSGT